MATFFQALFGGGSKAKNVVAPLPANEEENKKALRDRAAMNELIFTSGRGLVTPAPTGRKKNLGVE